MILDVSVLDQLTVWLSRDKVHFFKLIELNQSGILRVVSSRFKAEDVISEIIQEVEQVIHSGNFESYHVQIKFGEQFVCYSNFNQVETNTNSWPDLNDSDTFKGEEIKKFSELTNREKQVFFFIANGHSQEDVTAVLNMSLESLKFHRKNLYRKLGFNSKFELLKWYMKFPDENFTDS